MAMCPNYPKHALLHLSDTAIIFCYEYNVLFSLKAEGEATVFAILTLHPYLLVVRFDYGL
jgi:hypothetical protein